jgi:hypothetical protein
MTTILSILDKNGARGYSEEKYHYPREKNKIFQSLDVEYPKT